VTTDLPLDPIETASVDALRALQLARLQATLHHAYTNSPHYTQAFDAAGVHPSDCKTLADLAKFPFTSKQDLRENYPYGMFAVPQASIARIHASSGTTGKPTVVGYTLSDIAMWADCVARSIRAAGARRGDTVHVSYGYGLFTGGLGAHYGAEKLGLTVVPFGGGQTERQVQLIADFKPNIIMVTPSYMLALADEMDKQGLTTNSLRIGIFGAEPWTNDMRRAVERRVGITAVDIYGLSEVIGPGVASEYAEHQDGPTVWEDHFYPEIINPDTGQPVADGQMGELVFTSLTKQALPIIRYRTRDLTRLLAGTGAGGRSPMRRIEKITGRSDDMMIIRGVNVFPSQIEELILKEPLLAPHYQIDITRPAHMDELAVRVEQSPTANASASELALTAQRLAHAVKTYIGVSIDVKVLPAGSVERSAGKAKRVVDLRGQ
jgi:phenylacetate-CoA ligase